MTRAEQTNWSRLLTMTLVCTGIAVVIVNIFNESETLVINDSGISALTRSVLKAEPIVLDDFELISHQGDKFSVEKLKNRWTFLFFGYTHCPDVCPATLSQLVRIKNEIDSELLDVTQFVFVSVDPGRDTKKHLAEYISYFDKSFLALTGNQAQLDNLEKQLGVFHRYSDLDANGNYIVNHSTGIFLVDPEARVSASFEVPMDVGEVSRQYAGIQQWYKRKIL